MDAIIIAFVIVGILSHMHGCLKAREIVVRIDSQTDIHPRLTL